MLSGNRNKFSDFVKSEYGRLLNFVRARVEDSSDYDGEDILNDALAGIFERADLSTPVENVAAYMYRALRNRIIDTFRSERGESIPIDENISYTADIDGRYSPDRIFMNENIREVLDGVLNKLPRELSEVFIMNEIKNMTFREISEQTGTAPGTLMARKSRAVKILRTELSKILKEIKE